MRTSWLALGFAAGIGRAQCMVCKCGFSRSGRLWVQQLGLRRIIMIFRFVACDCAVAFLEREY